MATTLTNKIIKVIVDSKGVKSGVDDIERQLDRARSAVASTSREIDRELKKIDSNVNTGTSGTFFGALTGRKNLNTVPRRGDGRDPLAVAIGRNDFENYKSELSQATERAAALNRIYKVYEDAIARAAGEVRNSAAAERTLKAKREELARRISAAADAQNLSLSSRLRAAGGNGADSLGSGLRLSGAFNRDPGDADDLLGKIRSTISPSSGAAARLDREQNALGAAINDRQAEERRLRAIARSLGIKEDLTGKSLDELRQAIDGQANSMRSANSARQRIEASLNAQKQQELTARNRVISSLSLQRQQEQENELAKRNRVISSLAAQRAAALSDPDNLAALNRFERNRGQRLSTAVPEERIPFGVRAGRTALGAANQAASLVGGALRKVGGFVFSEFTNFISRVAANLTSRLIAGAVEGLELLAVKSVQAAARFQDAQVSFGVLAGGEGRGNRLVDDLQKLAIDTPFKFSEVLDESKLLLSYGVRVGDLTKRLRQLGDVASGTGVDLGRLSLAFGQVLAKGRLQGPEIRQFTEAGVGLQDFISAFNEIEGKNVSTQGFLALVEQGDVAANVVEKAFDKMTAAGGRFFNFMEVRSKTVSGRFNALSESLELVAQKVGKSIFEKFDVAGSIDSVVKFIQRIDFGGIDRRIGSFANAALPFGNELVAGFKGLMGELSRSFGTLVPNSNDLSEIFKFISQKIIPGVIEVSVILGRVFLSVVKVGLLLADAFGRIYNQLPSSSKLPDLRSAIVGLTVGGLTSLVASPVVGLAAGLAATAGTESGLSVTGERGRSTGKNSAISDIESKIAGFQSILDKLDLPGSFLSGTKNAKFTVDAAKNFLDEQRKKFSQAAVAEVIDSGVVFLDGVRRDGFTVDKNGLLVNSDGDKFVDTGPPVIPSDTQAKILEAQNVLSKDQQEKEIRLAENISKLSRQFAQLTDGVVRDFGDALKGVGGKIIPQFGERLEKINALAEKRADNPLSDFQANLATVNALDNPLARGLGLGLTPDKAARVRGLLGQELIERFKPPEVKPAPLVRANSQEAEQSLTRAIYDARNDSKTPEEELKAAIDEAKRVQETNNVRLGELAEALKGPVGNNFEFLGVGFPP